MVHQHFRLVSPFTVAENIVLGEHREEARSFVLHPRQIERRVAQLEQRYGLALDPGARVWQLSVGEQQRVEILKVLYRDSRILILDEPTAVLTPQESEALFATLRTMAGGGADGDLHLPQAPGGEGGLRPGDGAPRREERRDRGDRGRHVARARRADGRAAGRAGPAPGAADAGPRGACARGGRPQRARRPRRGGGARHVVHDPPRRDPRRRGRRRQRAARARGGRHGDAPGRRWGGARRGVAAADRRPARRDRGRGRARPRGPPRHRRRAQPDDCGELGAEDVPPGAGVPRAAARVAQDPRRRRRIDRALPGAGVGDERARARALRRQPAEAGARPRVFRRAARRDRGVADARARRRRDRDGARLSARGRRTRASGSCC